MSGRLKIAVFPVVSVCTIIGIVVFIVVIGCVVWNVFLSCRSCAKKLVRSASRSLLSGGGSLERSEGEGFALVAAGGSLHTSRRRNRKFIIVVRRRRYRR